MAVYVLLTLSGLTNKRDTYGAALLIGLYMLSNVDLC